MNHETESHQTPDLLVTWSWTSSLQSLRNQRLFNAPICDFFFPKLRSPNCFSVVSVFCLPNGGHIDKQ